MQLPMQITFKRMKPSQKIEEVVREHAAKLDEFGPRITSCRVVVDMPHRHHRRGNLYHVRIDITLPGEEIVVNHEPSEQTVRRDLMVAIREAFDAAKRQVEDYVRRQRRDVKHHEPLPHARIARFSPEAHHGFLETLDGREIYFHEDAVLGVPVARLEIGEEVTFVEEAGDEGPQASTVRLVGHQHHAG